MKLTRDDVQRFNELLVLTSFDYQTSEEKQLQSNLNAVVGRMMN
jgi:hypothetical protein